MRGVLTALVVLAFAIATAAAGGATLHGRALPTKASLRLAASAPLTFRGRGFHAKEKVRVAVTLAGAKTVRFVRATRLGAFTVQVATAVPYDPCNADLVATAAGARGDSAVLKLPQRACPPSP